MARKSRKFGKYEILEKLGEGGFGEVYKAQDSELGRVVALKVIKVRHLEDPDAVERFHQEARTAAGLDHPHIVPVYEVSQHQGIPFIAMKYISGRPLDRVIGEEGRLSLDEVVRIVSQVAEALDYAHGHGVVHRDVKPSNIIVDDEGRAVVTDFGLARGISRSSSYTSAGALVGTAEYMAPEQLDVDRLDQVGPATDQYALAVTVYQMLAGRVPFEGSTAAVLAAHLTKSPPRLRSLVPDVPEGVEEAVLRALAKDPAERFESTAALVAPMQACLKRMETERQLETWHAQAVEAEKAGQWRRVIVLSGQILERDASFRDVGAMLTRANERLSQEVDEQERQARLTELREQATRAHAKQEWKALLTAGQAILELEPADKKAQAWCRHAEEALARQEAEERRRAQLAGQRQRGATALTEEDWPTLKAAAGKVLSLDPDDRQAKLWQRVAEEALARRAGEQERQARLDAAKGQAREALEARDWPRLLACSQTVLLLAPEDAEASHWKETAETGQRGAPERLERGGPPVGPLGRAMPWWMLIGLGAVGALVLVAGGSLAWRLVAGKAPTPTPIVIEREIVVEKTVVQTVVVEKPVAQTVVVEKEVVQTVVVEKEVVVAAASPETGIWHVVQPGETLPAIAMRYGTTVDAIVQANGLRNTDYLYVEQQLVIPFVQPTVAPVGAALPATPTYTPTPIPTSTATFVLTNTPLPPTATPSPPPTLVPAPQSKNPGDKAGEKKVRFSLEWEPVAGWSGGYWVRLWPKSERGSFKISELVFGDSKELTLHDPGSYCWNVVAAVEEEGVNRTVGNPSEEWCFEVKLGR